jgi:hypothetical protein
MYWGRTSRAAVGSEHKTLEIMQPSMSSHQMLNNEPLSGCDWQATEFFLRRPIFLETDFFLHACMHCMHACRCPFIRAVCHSNQKSAKTPSLEITTMVKGKPLYFDAKNATHVHAASGLGYGALRTTHAGHSRQPA